MRATTEPTTALEKTDRCGDLPHRPRVLLGKMGLDGHDRGVKLIARLFRDSGIHVVYSGLWQTPRSLAIGARDEDVDCIACSMMSNSHLVLVPKLLDELKALGRPDITVNVGGIIPQEDVQVLIDAGVSEIFHTGTGMDEIVESVRRSVSAHVPAARQRSRDGIGSSSRSTPTPSAEQEPPGSAEESGNRRASAPFLLAASASTRSLSTVWPPPTAPRALAAASALLLPASSEERVARPFSARSAVTMTWRSARRASRRQLPSEESWRSRRPRTRAGTRLWWR